VENRFTLKPGEGVYGFGFTGDDEVNRRGKELLLVQTNVGIIIPGDGLDRALRHPLGHLFADALQGRRAGRAALGGKRARRRRLLFHGRRHAWTTWSAPIAG
jgi:hypothetical protein